MMSDGRPPELDDGALVAWLQPELGDRLTLQARTRLPGGASRETHLVELAAGGERLAVVVQRRLPWVLPLGVPPSVEAAVLRTAAPTVPVPRVVAWDDTGAFVGAPALATLAVEGVSDPRALYEALDPGAAETLGLAYARTLAALQRVDVSPVTGLPPEDALDELHRRYADLHEPRPTLSFGLRWLHHHRPAPPPAPVLVHGDFRHGNAIVSDGRIAAVIDWELAHLGDPDEDLAWFLLRAWRYGRALAAGGLAPLDRFVDAYADAAGRTVDPDRLRWWAALGTVRWGVLCLLEGSTHRSGRRRSIELAAVGHRVVEAEHDLLLLLDGALDRSVRP